MATRLPGNEAPGCNTDDMRMIHGFYRKLYRDAVPMIQSVKAGDAKHRTAVAAHLDEITDSLHNHHRSEDLLLWDTLSARAPSCAIHVEQMKAQHTEVGSLLDQAETLIPRWRESGAPTDADALVEAIEAVRDKLLVHLGNEEEQILPVASVAMRQREWDLIGKHARSAIPGNRRLMNLGYILDSMTPEAGAVWIRANLPAPIRLIYRLVGKRQFEAEQRVLHPGAV